MEDAFVTPSIIYLPCDLPDRGELGEEGEEAGVEVREEQGSEQEA